MTSPASSASPAAPPSSPPPPDPAPRPRVAFISGLIAPSPTWFATHYAARLTAAIAAGDHFVLGPAPGIDEQALTFLHAHTTPERITVFFTEHESSSPEFRTGRLAWHEAAGGLVRVAGVTTGERDAEATAESDYDVLRYFTEEEARAHYGPDWWPRVSATERNERRRKVKDGVVEEVVVGAEKGGGGRGRLGKFVEKARSKLVGKAKGK
ncbi:hypothetical protein EDC01DRAFT_730908 [Geopyxis carbonaria]|nr:hypothetical protein EDC01DRAFT_730908 [Geopyxis carbonaria]